MIRVFPRRTKWTPTDDLAFVGYPPLFRPPEQPVRVSVTFTWDLPEGTRLAKAWEAYYSDVQLGGPAFGDPGGEFEPGRFVVPGVTITSRGCPHQCPWCYVPKRTAGVREYPIRDGWIVQDDNLLACSRPHIEAVAEMLRRQKRAVHFAGGLDARLLRDWHREVFDGLRVAELWFACDSKYRLPDLERAAKILDGIPERKRRAYVLMGFGDESLDEAERRVERVYELGFLPFAQLYQGMERQEYGREWRALARKWSRPAAYRRAA
jgi:hypothetical protein